MPPNEPEPDGAPVPESYRRELRQLVAYWRRIHPATGLPGRQHFDPIDVPGLLPHIWMLDVFRDPWRFRFRLVGTAIVKFVGRDSTGRWLDEVIADFENTDACRLLVKCAAEGVPVYCTARGLSRPSSTHRVSQRVHLPLATDGSCTDIILSLTRYIRPDTAPEGI